MTRNLKKSDENRLNAVIKRPLSAFAPPDCAGVTEWADKKRRLSSEASAEVGAWRTSRTPYLKEIMDAFTDVRVRRIVFASSSQVGKSEVMNNMIGYIIDEDPGSVLFIQPTVADAKEYSKFRLAPMIRDTPCLKNKVRIGKSRDSKNTVLQKAYPGGILTLCGSTKAHSLCSKPIKNLFCDEMDRWANVAGEEGDPLELAYTRQVTFYNAKMVEVSTPTIRGASRIEDDYKKGTMERYCSRCPHCGKFSEIRFSNIRFEYNETGETEKEKAFEVTDVFYICPECGGTSTEREMKTAEAKWIAEKPEVLALHGIRSFWLTAFVSPWITWRDIIVRFLLAKGDTNKLQVVYNTLFGELWEIRDVAASEDELMLRREEYKAELPFGVLALTCGIDTQDDRLEYEVVGHGHFGETWGIRKGIIMGRPDADEVWQMLDDVLDHVYRFENGVGLKISFSFMDEGGHFTMNVRKECAKRIGKRLFAIKGVGGEDVSYVAPPKKHNILFGGVNVGTCYVYAIGVDSGKQLIMDSLKVKEAGKGYSHFPKRDDYGSVYFHGLVSEHLVYSGDKKKCWSWKKIPGHERNEALDCRNYAIAAFKAFSPDLDAIDAKLKSLESGEETAQIKKPLPPSPKKRKTAGKYFDDW